MAAAAETPEQEIARLRREISQLRRLRADLPRMILEPYMDEAKAHIGQVASRLAVAPTIPAPEAIAVYREAALSTTQPAPPAPVEEAPAAVSAQVQAPSVPLEVTAAQVISGAEAVVAAAPAAVTAAVSAAIADIGSTVQTIAEGIRGVIVSFLPRAAASPVEWDVLVLTEDGRLITVAPTNLIVTGRRGRAAPAAPPAPSFKIGDRVRDKTTGETGTVVELAEDKAGVALDRGAFITRAVADLEPAT